MTPPFLDTAVWLWSFDHETRRIDSNALTPSSRNRLPLNDCLASRKEKTISFRLWIGKALKLKLSGSSQVLTWSSQNAKRVVSNVFLNINICQFRFLQMRISSIVENLLSPWVVDPPELFLSRVGQLLLLDQNLFSLVGCAVTILGVPGSLYSSVGQTVTLGKFPRHSTLWSWPVQVSFGMNMNCSTKILLGRSLKLLGFFSDLFLLEIWRLKMILF